MTNRHPTARPDYRRRPGRDPLLAYHAVVILKRLKKRLQPALRRLRRGKITGPLPGPAGRLRPAVRGARAGATNG